MVARCSKDETIDGLFKNIYCYDILPVNAIHLYKVGDEKQKKLNLANMPICIEYLSIDHLNYNLYIFLSSTVKPKAHYRWNDIVE